MYPSGGIKPPSRQRSRAALTLAEREAISRGVVAGRSVRAIAKALTRAPSTISREITRNGGSGRYRAAAADKRAWKKALPKIVQAGEEFALTASCCGKA
jgi:IS30 family transposase